MKRRNEGGFKRERDMRNKEDVKTRGRKSEEKEREERQEKWISHPTHFVGFLFKCFVANGMWGKR